MNWYVAALCMISFFAGGMAYQLRLQLLVRKVKVLVMVLNKDETKRGSDAPS